MPKILFSVFFIFFAFLKCSPEPYSAGIQVKNKKNKFNRTVVCQGSNCCSKVKDCIRICDQIFYNSTQKTVEQCYALAPIQVEELESVLIVLRSPILEDLRRLNLTSAFRLLLQLDFLVFIQIIKQYNINEARELLLWFAGDEYLIDEFESLSSEIINEILYETLASAGDRTLYGPVEEGLVNRISFDQSFFWHIIKERNYSLLQMTHQMIKDDLCSSQYNTSRGQTYRCTLRVYCRERINQKGEYIHSEELRNSISRNIKDKEFFDYIEKEVLYIGIKNRGLFRSNMIDNQVCENICNANNSRGCE